MYAQSPRVQAVPQLQCLNLHFISSDDLQFCLVLALAYTYYCSKNLVSEYSTCHPILFHDFCGAGLGSPGSISSEVIDSWWLLGFQKRKPLVTCLRPCLLYFSVSRIGLGWGKAENLLIRHQAIWCCEEIGNCLSSVYCAVGLVKIVSVFSGLFHFL